MWLHGGSWTIWSSCSGKRQGRIGESNHPHMTLEQVTEPARLASVHDGPGTLKHPFCISVSDCPPEHSSPALQGLLWCFQVPTDFGVQFLARKGWKLLRYNSPQRCISDTGPNSAITMIRGCFGCNFICRYFSAWVLWHSHGSATQAI